MRAARKPPVWIVLCLLLFSPSLTSRVVCKLKRIYQLEFLRELIGLILLEQLHLISTSSAKPSSGFLWALSTNEAPCIVLNSPCSNGLNTLLSISGVGASFANNSIRNPLGRLCDSKGCNRGDDRAPLGPVRSTSSISTSCSMSDVNWTHCARTSANTVLIGLTLLFFG
uniref:Putative secreted protein n=1 Tax=Panstrongylus lignarius TaxID=156445 RepID=A0A224XMB0_9HEMI